MEYTEIKRDSKQDIEVIYSRRYLMLMERTLFGHTNIKPHKGILNKKMCEKPEVDDETKT